MAIELFYIETVILIMFNVFIEFLGNEGSGSEAERALLRIRNKLDGIEFGSILATSGQVARLIQQAMDIKNLSRLFNGWQPYL